MPPFCDKQEVDVYMEEEGGWFYGVIDDCFVSSYYDRIRVNVPGHKPEYSLNVAPKHLSPLGTHAHAVAAWRLTLGVGSAVDVCGEDGFFYHATVGKVATAPRLPIDPHERHGPRHDISGLPSFTCVEVLFTGTPQSAWMSRQSARLARPGSVPQLLAPNAWRIALSVGDRVDVEVEGGKGGWAEGIVVDVLAEGEEPPAATRRNRDDLEGGGPVLRVRYLWNTVSFWVARGSKKLAEVGSKLDTTWRGLTVGTGLKVLVDGHGYVDATVTARRAGEAVVEAALPTGGTVKQRVPVDTGRALPEVVASPHYAPHTAH